MFYRAETHHGHEKRKILIATALTETHRLDNFITNILDMAKLEGGKVKAKPEARNIAQLRSAPGIEPILDQSKRDGEIRRNFRMTGGKFRAREPARVFQFVIAQLHGGGCGVRGKTQHQR